MKKIFLATFAIVLFVSSCGFEVIYREKNDGISYQKELAAIKIQKDAGRTSQLLRNELYDTFNPESIKTEPKYYIVVKLGKSIGSSFLASTGASGRNKVTLTASYEFRDIENSELISLGTTSASDNYDVELNRYGTYTAENYAERNLVGTIAKNIRNLLVNDIIEMRKRIKRGESMYYSEEDEDVDGLDEGA